MTGLNEGWTYLSDAEGTWAYAVCGFTFALFMIPGGRIQDRYGPRLGATLGGLCLAAGCIVAGLMKSYTGLILGFGIFGGIGMGFGYAASTPAAVRWFGPHRRGLVVGPGGRLRIYEPNQLSRFQRTQDATGRGTLAPPFSNGEGFYGLQNAKFVDDLIKQRTPRDASTELAPAEALPGRGDELGPA